MIRNTWNKMNSRVNARGRVFTGAALAALFALPFAGCDLLGGSGSKASTSDDADSVALNVSWTSHATRYRADTNLRVAYDCPDSGFAHVVWGTDVYTDDSSVCTAGVHAGKITFAAGGRVIIKMLPGRAAYDSSTRNGVTTLSYPAWGGSYSFL